MRDLPLSNWRPAGRVLLFDILSFAVGSQVAEMQSLLGETLPACIYLSRLENPSHLRLGSICRFPCTGPAISLAGCKTACHLSSKHSQRKPLTASKSRIGPRL